MKHIVYLILAFALISCSKNESDSMLVDGEFNGYLVTELENVIDMNQTNKFSALALVGDWVPERASLETYVDGELTETKEISFNKEKISFYKWGTMKHSFSSGETSTGKWTYSHNFLIWQYDGLSGGYAYEVMSASNTRLVIRQESYSVGVKNIPFYQDMSGTHSFRVIEYRKEE